MAATDRFPLLDAHAHLAARRTAAVAQQFGMTRQETAALLPARFRAVIAEAG